MTYDKRSRLLYQVIGDEIRRVLRSEPSNPVDHGIVQYLQLLSWLQLEVAIPATKEEENDS